MSARSTVAIACFAIAVATVAEARAQSYAQAPPSVTRDGFTAGGSLGLSGFSTEGEITADGGGVAYELHLGGMLTPKLALLVEGFGTAGDCDTCDEGFDILTGGIVLAGQYWVGSRLWIKGGYGSGRMGLRAYEDFVSGPHKGRALLAALGLELLQRQSHAMDLQVRGMFGKYEGGDRRSSALAAMIGFHFY